MSSNELYLIGTCHIDIDGPSRLENLLVNINPDVIATEMTEARADNFEIPSQKINIDAVIEQKKKEWKDLIRKYTVDDVDFFNQKQKEFYEILGINLNPTQIASMELWPDILSASYGYEFRVPIIYAKNNPGVQVNYIDLPEDDLEKISKGHDDLIDATTSVVLSEDNHIGKSFFEACNNGLNKLIENNREFVASFYSNLDEFNETFVAARSRISEFNDNAYLTTVIDPRREEYMVNKMRELYEVSRSSLVVIVGGGHLKNILVKISDLKPIAKTLAEYESL